MRLFKSFQTVIFWQSRQTLSRVGQLISSLYRTLGVCRALFEEKILAVDLGSAGNRPNSKGLS